MLNIETPDTWTDKGRHPEHGVSAKSVAYFEHESGVELMVWQGVKVGSAVYDITEEDEYSVELMDGDDILVGEAFETEDEARDAAMDAIASIEN